MSGQTNASLQLNLLQRPKYLKCAHCTRFNEVCTHVSKFDENDPTRAYVQIYTGNSETECGWQPAIASLDSGTKQEWVSGDALKWFTNPIIQDLSPPETYNAFQGNDYTATKMALIRWHTMKNKKSRQSWFRVVDSGPFDVVIGAETLFGEGIYIFNEAALLFFHRAPKPGEEARMQQTLAEQSAEVRQYAADRAVEQDRLHQQQRAELDYSGYQSSRNNLSQASQSAHGNPSDSQRRQYPGPGHNVSDPRTAMHPQQGMTYTSYANFSPPSKPPTYRTAVGIQGEGLSAARASLGRDQQTNSNARYGPSFNNNGPSTSALYTGQFWSCLNCSNRNDPARDPEECPACGAPRRG